MPNDNQQQLNETPPKPNGSTPCGYCHRTLAQGCVCSNPIPTYAQLAEIAKNSQKKPKLNPNLEDPEVYEARMKAFYAETEEASEQLGKEASSGVVKAESNKDRLARIRKAKSRNMSIYIRIGESDLYDFAPVTRAVLKEIGFLEVQEENTKVPEYSPFKGQYVGWCYASQKKIAFRVGTTEPTVFQIIKTLIKDGVIESRTWTDTLGYPHNEYHVVDGVVDKHQRPDGYMAEDRSKQPRKGGNKTANKGSFKTGNNKAAKKQESQPSSQALPKKQESHPSSQPLPPKFAAVSHPSSQPLPPKFAAVWDTAVNSEENGRELGGGGYSLASSETKDDFLLRPSGAASALASAAAGAAELECNACGRSASTNKKTKALLVKEMNAAKEKKPELANTHNYEKPLPNRLCYPELYAKWVKGGGGRLPKCKRCGETLHWEENHVCPGYIPQLPYDDMGEHVARMEDQREEHHELIAHGRSKPTCERCDEVVYEEDALRHDEECQG